MKSIEERIKQKFASEIKEIKKEETALVNLLMGEVMKLSKGRANPEKVRKLILEEINSLSK